MLTEDQLAAYRRDGVLTIKAVITGPELERLIAATDRVQQEAITYGRELDAQRPLHLNEEHGFADWDEFDDKQFLYAKGRDGERVWRRAEGMWQRDEIFRLVTANRSCSTRCASSPASTSCPPTIRWW
jgi:hypothetical protein